MWLKPTPNTTTTPSSMAPRSGASTPLQALRVRPVAGADDGFIDGAPSGSGRVYTARGRVRQTARQGLAERIPRQVAADEHQRRLACLAFAPGPADVGIHHHVHALEHDAVVHARERDDALV